MKLLSDYKGLVGELLFRQIFELAPTAISLDHFGDGLECSLIRVPEAVYPTFLQNTRGKSGRSTGFCSFDDAWR